MTPTPRHSRENDPADNRAHRRRQPTVHGIRFVVLIRQFDDVWHGATSNDDAAGTDACTLYGLARGEAIPKTARFWREYNRMSRVKDKA